MMDEKKLHLICPEWNYSPNIDIKIHLGHTDTIISYEDMLRDQMFNTPLVGTIMRARVLTGNDNSDEVLNFCAYNKNNFSEPDFNQMFTKIENCNNLNELISLLKHGIWEKFFANDFTTVKHAKDEMHRIMASIETWHSSKASIVLAAECLIDMDISIGDYVINDGSTIGDIISLHFNCGDDEILENRPAYLDKSGSGFVYNAKIPQLATIALKSEVPVVLSTSDIVYYSNGCITVGRLSATDAKVFTKLSKAIQSLQSKLAFYEHVTRDVSSHKMIYGNIDCNTYTLLRSWKFRFSTMPLSFRNEVDLLYSDINSIKHSFFEDIKKSMRYTPIVCCVSIVAALGLLLSVIQTIASLIQIIKT